MLDETIEHLKECRPEKYKEYKLELCGMANDYEFSEEKAKEIVSKMKPLGEKWNISTTNQVKDRYGINARNTDFYLVMNSMANDYSRVISTDQVEVYARMSEAFINDEDATNHKVWKYYTKMIAK